MLPVALQTISSFWPYTCFTAWAAIFAVSTALAGIWGMNFEVMPELQWRWGYPMALAVIAAAAALLYRRFRRVGWL